MNDNEYNALEAAVVAGAHLGNAIDKSLSDDKVTLADALNFAPVAKDVISVFGHRDDFATAFKDIDDDAKARLTSKFIEEFDIVEDNVESVVENAIGVAAQLVDAVSAAVALAKAAKKKE